MQTTATAARTPIVTQSDLIQAGIPPATADALVEAFEMKCEMVALRWMQGMTLMLVSLLVGQMLLSLGG